MKRLRALQKKWRYPRTARHRALLAAMTLFAAATLGLALIVHGLSSRTEGLEKRHIADLLGEHISAEALPESIDLELDGQPIRALFHYGLDAGLQGEMESLFTQYRPDFGAFVAMDARTGRILSLVSYHAPGQRLPAGQTENLALRATFPSASIFKVVTATAAIAKRHFTGDTKIAFNGRNHTLYKGNVLKNQFNRWTRFMRLEDAFALSVNTVFGKIGVFEVGQQTLQEYAHRFYFDRPIPADLLVQEGHAAIADAASANEWDLAEAASGFTRDNTMSPIHGAMIASAVVNDGVMMEPYLVSSVNQAGTGVNHEGASQLYEAVPRIAGTTMDSATAAEMRSLMRATVQRGTSRGSFRGFFKPRDRKGIEVGGKTGSLRGLNPQGRYDWFVGYAQDEFGTRIAVSAMTIHRDYWRVKSSYLARRAFENYFGARRFQWSSRTPASFRAQ